MFQVEYICKKKKVNKNRIGVSKLKNISALSAIC